MLAALGRDDEAAQRLAEFDAAFFPVVAEDENAEDSLIAGLLGPPGSLVRTLLREACLAEAALNLNLAERSREIFRSRLAAAETGSARFAHLAVTSQMLLAADAKSEYLAFMTDELIPSLENTALSLPPDADANGSDDEWTPLVAALTAVPLYYPEFFAGFGKEELRQLTAGWEATRETMTTKAGRALIDHGLASMYAQLGDEEQRLQAVARLEAAGARRINDAGPVTQRENPMQAFRLLRGDFAGLLQDERE